MKFYKKACVVIPVTGPLRAAVSEAANSVVSAGQVRVDNDPHLTLRYGIRNEDPDTLRALRNIFKNTKSFAVQLGELKTFDVSEHSENQYPLVIRCETSPELTELFNKISRKVDCDPFSFPSYSPHITLGYIPSPDIPTPTLESARGLQGMYFPVYRADLLFRDGRRVPFPVGTTSETLDRPYSEFTAVNRPGAPVVVGEGLEDPLQGQDAPLIGEVADEFGHSFVEQAGTIYLLHYPKKLKHAGHYLGWTKHNDPSARINAHAIGKSGAALPRAFHANGSKPVKVRTWKNVDRNFERKLKNNNNGPRLCPICNPKSHHTHGLE